MGNTKNFFAKTIFNKNTDMRVRVFHVLAFTGFIVCLIMAAVSAVGGRTVSMLINAAAGALSLFLLVYSSRKENYPFCYMATIVVIFFVLFPCLFFIDGGYKGGMPFFFVFAVTFTVYMLDGWKMLFTALTEILFYIFLIIFAYWHPQWIEPFSTEKAMILDIIAAGVVVSISLGATMYSQIQMYRHQQNQLEEAQQHAQAANEAKSEFLACMSHEIRTPIHMILGMNEIVMRESRGLQMQEYAEKIDEAGKILLSLVDSVLDLSKIEASKIEVIPSEYESASLISNISLVGKSQCERQKLGFHCCVGENIPQTLVGDVSHIQQIAANLLSNAAKYTQSGSVTLHIAQEPGRMQDEIYLVISVQDTGIGIRTEEQSQLFDAFNRVDSSAHRQIRGTGLGLTIVKKLTDLLEGQITVDSEPDRGSTFTVKLPQKIVYTDKKMKKCRVSAFEAPEIHMLAVDDNEGNRMLMQELLRPTRIQLDLASSGEECLQMAKSSCYHVILMDYMMPGMDGLQTMEQLQRMENFHTPVIVLTADATVETREKLMAAGFASCLTKPIPWESLRDEILRYLPEELIHVKQEDEQDRLKNAKCLEIVSHMIPYGISLEDGLRYFNHNLNEYSQAARAILSHDDQEQDSVKQLWKEENYPQMRFHIHALKGKARNLGINTLADICGHVENLCVSDEKEEIQSLMPYLMYLWKKGVKGITLLLEENVPVEDPDILPDKNTGETLKMLPEMLREFRRKPSLQCIASVLSNETAPEGRRILCEMEQLVNAISFEQAEEKLEEYFKWKEGSESRDS